MFFFSSLTDDTAVIENYGPNDAMQWPCQDPDLSD